MFWSGFIDIGSVPNVPCGVERPETARTPQMKAFVPNAPCGVESYYIKQLMVGIQKFLMYRVELKENKQNSQNCIWKGS